MQNDTAKADVTTLTTEQLLAEVRRRCELDGDAAKYIGRAALTNMVWDFIDYTDSSVVRAIRESSLGDYELLGAERYEALYEATRAAILPEAIEAIQGFVHPTGPDDVLYAYRTGERLLIENKVYGPYSTQARMI